MIETPHSAFHRRRHLSPWVKFGLPGAGIVLLWLLYRGMPVLFTSLMLSWGLFYVLNPLVEFLESHSLRRGAASALVLLGLMVVFYIMWLRLLNVSVDLRAKVDLDEFQRNLIDRAHRVLIWAQEQAPMINRFTKEISMPDRMGAFVDTQIRKYAHSFAFEGFILAGKFLLGTILTAYFTFFFLKDGRAFKKTVVRWIPNRYFEPALKFFYEMDRRMRSYLLSMLLDCGLVGLLVGIGSALVGAPYPVVFGLIAFALNTIPLVGPLFYGAICLIITIGAGKPSEVILGFIGVFVLSRLCDDLIFMPTIYGKSHKIHPVLIVGVVLLGEHFAGAWGMFLAVPITSIILLGMKIAREISEGEDMTPLPPSAFTPFA